MISAHCLSVHHCLFCFYSFSHSPRRNRKFVRLSLPAKTLEGQLHNALSSFKGIPVSSSGVLLNLFLFPGGNLPSPIPPLPLTRIFLRYNFAASYITQLLLVSIVPHPTLYNWCFSRACYGLKPHSNLRLDLSSIVHNSTPGLFCK